MTAIIVSFLAGAVAGALLVIGVALYYHEKEEDRQ